MATYNVRVTVQYEYEVEADTLKEAEEAGWDYEDFSYTGEVYNIEVEELESDEDEEDE